MILASVQQADAAIKSADFPSARMELEEALRGLERTPELPRGAEIEAAMRSRLAKSCFECGAYWDAIGHADCMLSLTGDPLFEDDQGETHERLDVMISFAASAMRLGLLGFAMERLSALQSVCPDEVKPYLQEARRRQALVDGSDVQQEITLLTAALGPEITSIAAVGARDSRELHRALQVATRRKMREALSSSDVYQDAVSKATTTGGRYRCVPPDRLPVASISAPAHRMPVLHEAALDQLRRERIVVIDEALPADVIAAAAAEVEGMAARGILQTDPDHNCNPNNEHHHLQLWQRGALERLATIVPGLAACVRALWELPGPLADTLGLSVRVPQELLIARYPPGAYYKKHLDSYAGADIPRIITVLLYLRWAPQRGGELRCHLPAGPRDISPVPGRCVVFLSQEVEHEVRMSEGERYGLTLWIWDEKKDKHGR